MDFKKGDWVIRVDNRRFFITLGGSSEIAYKVINVHERTIAVDGISFFLGKENFKKCPVYNELNIRLYPNYVKKDNFLVPLKTI